MAKKQFALYHANKQLAIDYLGGKCHDCGLVTHQIEVYDFHHLDPTAKEMNVGSLFRLAWSTITHELNKCALLCANCHRVRERGIDEVNLLARCVAAGSPPPVFMRAAA
jgi:hypothetical protein